MIPSSLYFRTCGLLCALVTAVCCSSPVDAGNWPRFRGPNGSGVAAGEAELPAKIGPEENLLWNVPLAKGHSSPVVFGDRIFLTAFRDRKLVTLGIDVRTGKTLWEAVSKYKTLERFHRIGSPATPSVVTDGEVVVSFFGSSGMNVYTPDGKLLWHKPMGPFNNQFGATSSPILAGDRIISVQYHDTGSYLAAFNKQTGKQLWRTERPNVRRNYGSPVLWKSGETLHIVVAGTAHVEGFDVTDGRQLWSVRGLCRVVSNTPVVGNDGRLYAASTGGGSTPPQPAFTELLKGADKNKNGELENSELPASRIKSFFGQFDRDRNGRLNKTEYETIREIFRISRSAAIAVRPGGKGDVTESHVAWSYGRGIPRNASPLVYDGRMYLVKDGGVLTVLDTKTGRLVKQMRLAGRGKYFSSPVVGDGKLYVIDDRGTLTVLALTGDLKQLHTARFGESVLATPAIANGRIYVRTVGRLYCFGKK